MNGMKMSLCAVIALLVVFGNPAWTPMQSALTLAWDGNSQDAKQEQEEDEEYDEQDEAEELYSDEEAYYALKALQKEFNAITASGDPERVADYEKRIAKFVEEYSYALESFGGSLLSLNLLTNQQKWGKVIELGEIALEKYSENISKYEFLYYFVGIASHQKKKNDQADLYLRRFLEKSNNPQMRSTASVFLAKINVRPGKPAPELNLIDTDGQDFSLIKDGLGKVVLINVWAPW